MLQQYGQYGSQASSSPSASQVIPWLPAAWEGLIVLGIVLYFVPWPSAILRPARSVKSLLSPLTRPEDFLSPEDQASLRRPLPLKRSVALAASAALFAASWLSVTGYAAAFGLSKCFQPASMALAWMSAAALLIRPSVTPDYSVLGLTVLQTVYHGNRLVLSHFSSGRDFLKVPNLLHLVAIAVGLLMIGCIMSKPMLKVLPARNVARSVDEEVSEKYTNPEDRANLYSCLTFAWITPMLDKGQRKELKFEDVWTLSPLNWAKHLHLKFKEEQRSNLALRLFLLNFLDILLDGALQLITTLLKFAPAFYTKQILESLALPEQARYASFKWALLALVTDYISAQLDALHLFHANRAISRMRSQLVSALHEKTLLRTDQSGVVKPHKTRMEDHEQDYSGASTGRIVNLLSSDISYTISMLTYLSMLLEVPLQLGIALIFLYTLLGWASFAGLAVLIITVPLNNWLMRQNKSVMKALSEARDERINAVHTFIRAIRFIRSHDWQDRWQTKILGSREKELKLLMNRRFGSLALGLVWQLSPPAIIVLSFGAFTLVMKQQLTVPVAFVAISLFGNLSGPLTFFPQLVLQIMLAQNSVRRLQAFFREPEVADSASSLKSNVGPGVDPRRVTIQGEFAWTSRDASEALSKKVDPASEESAGEQPSQFRLAFPKAIVFDVGINIIAGPTASGKSSLLQALLGEMPCVSGEGPHLFKPLGNVSYGAQSSWIETGAVRDNILFGLPFDQHRYDAVLDACCLRPDVALWDGGDLVEVGERGIALSGGQKARIALAKCLYSYSKVMLLDDPLSAVDSHTASWLLHRCFMSPLVDGRVIILVTHHLDLVGPAASQVIELESGTVSKISIQKPAELTPAQMEELKVPPPRVDDQAPNSRLVQDESMASGSVSWSVYKRYIKSMGYGVWPVLAILMASSRFVSFLENWVVKEWAEANATVPSTYVHYGQMNAGMADFVEAASSVIESNSQPESPMRFLMIYVGIVLLGLLLDQVTTAVVYIATLKASRKLFEQLLASVARTKMRWFDSTPAGRILNRFSEDFTKVDGSLSMSFRALLSCFVRVLAHLIIVSFLLPWFLIAAVVLALIIFYISRPYVNTARSLRRLDAVYKSPIYSNFSEVVFGISTIRAFGAEERYQSRMYSRLDSAMKIQYTYSNTNRWLYYRFDLLGACVRFITYSLIIFTGISQGLAAIAIVSCGSLVSVWQSLISMSAQLELDLNAIERVDEYIGNEPESALIVENNRPPLSWPSDQGGIEVENLNISYADDLPVVLKNVSFSIKPGEKIGLVGRTGSGKSTFGLALLRFVEAQSGRLIIDGIDVSTIGLSDLRRNITVMSQDAVLFAGTIKENLDPFDEHDTNELWDVLLKVGMAGDPGSAPSTAEPSRAASLDNAAAAAEEGTSSGSSDTAVGIRSKAAISSLDDLVAENGNNFSAGERQLLALARALLRRPKILLMDEASSSIDKAADARLQGFIKDAFASSTVITIAHRLLTVCEYDRILVLDAGQVVEYDSPKALLSQGRGFFYDLCIKTTESDEIFSALGENKPAQQAT